MKFKYTCGTRMAFSNTSSYLKHSSPTTPNMRISQPANIPIIHAYLLEPFTAEELNKVHEDFELGSCARFAPMYRLFIHDEPKYHGMTHAEIRKKLNKSGQEEDFLLLDKEFKEQAAGWIVQNMVTQYNLDDEQAVSMDDVWEILTVISHVPIALVNYDIANMSLQEDLPNAGMHWPYDPQHYPQTKARTSGLDMKEFQYGAAVWLVAETGEYEEKEYEDSGASIMRLGSGLGKRSPDKVQRLREDLAEANGIIADWTSGNPTTERNGKTYPKGSLTLQHKWDPDHNWPPYERVEGSL